MKAQTQIYNSQIQHQMLMLKYFKSKDTEMFKILDNDNDLLLYTINKELKEMSNDYTRSQENKWQSLYKKIDKLRYAPIKEFQTTFRKELDTVIIKELKYILELMNSAIPLEIEYKEPNTDKIIPFGLIYGSTFDNHFKQFEFRDSEMIKNTISRGFSQGLTSEQIIKSVEGSRNLNYQDGVLQTSRNNADAIITTLGIGVANSTMDLFARANPVVFNAWKYEAILDNRTTKFCIDHDGLIYSVLDFSAPYPPNHYRCRSKAVYIISMGLIGNRIILKDSKGNTKQIDFRQEARLNSPDKWKGMSDTDKNSAVEKLRTEWFNENIGALPKDVNFKDWYASQPEEFKKIYESKNKITTKELYKLYT